MVCCQIGKMCLRIMLIARSALVWSISMYIASMHQTQNYQQIIYPTQFHHYDSISTTSIRAISTYNRLLFVVNNLVNWRLQHSFFWILLGY